MNPYLVTSENPQDLPILIIDKRGEIGSVLTNKLSAEFLVIFVHGDTRASGNNVICVPYRHKIPSIPDNLFSYIFIISEHENDLYHQVRAFSQRAKESDAQIIAVVPAATFSQKQLDKLKKVHPEITVIVYGDVFGGQDELSVVDVYLQQALQLNRVTTSRSGVERSYPVYLPDVIAGIVRIIFSEKYQGELFFLMPNFFVTDISLIRMMQKELPELQVVTSKKSRPPSPYFLSTQGIFIFPAYEIEERIKLALQEGKKRGVAPIPLYAPSALSLAKSKFKSAMFGSGIFLGLLMLLLGIGYLSILFFKPSSSIKSIMSNNTSTAITAFGISVAKQAVDDIAPLSELAGFGVQTEQLADQLETAQQLTALVVTANTLQKSLTVKSGMKEADIQESRVQIKKLFVDYISLQQSKRIPLSIEKKIAPYFTFLRSFNQFADVLPQLTGVKEKQTYLVLFQNNMELRGGGGFIGSYGLLTLEKGRIKEFSLHDVYDLDGQMKDDIAPPFFMKRYLGSSHLFLRDSNYAVDFPTAAKQVNLLYYLESKNRVDGVLSIDTTFLSELIGILGPITLSDYHETITKDNFFMITQSHVEDNFFPGSTQKKDFLKALHHALEQRLTQAVIDNPEKLLSFFTQMLSSRHMQFYSEEPSIENLFLVSGLSATTQELRAKQRGIFNDFISLNESNVGQNKGNYYLRRAVAQKISLTERGDEEVMLGIDYTNTSKKESKFGGSYKSYIQIVVPGNAQLSSIIIDGEKQKIIPAVTDPTVYSKPVKKGVGGLEVETQVVGERKVFAFPMTIAEQVSKHVEISYLVPQTVQFIDNTYVYNYLFSKQPGVLSDAFRVTIDYPNTLRLVDLPKTMEKQDGQVTFSGSLTTDQAFSIGFIKN